MRKVGPVRAATVELEKPLLTGDARVEVSQTWLTNGAEAGQGEQRSTPPKPGRTAMRTVGPTGPARVFHQGLQPRGSKDSTIAASMTGCSLSSPQLCSHQTAASRQTMG